MFAKFWFLAHLLTLAAGKPWSEDYLDPELSYLLKANDLDQEYDALQAVTFGKVYETTDIKDAPKAKVASFNRVPAGEAGYTAVIYGYYDYDKMLGEQDAFALPVNGICGAVLLTTDTLLTLCACVAPFLDWMRTTKGKGPFDWTEQFAKKFVDRDYVIPTEEIYVWYGVNVWKPWLQDWRIKISRDVNRQYMNNGWCYQGIDRCTDPSRYHICQRGNPAILKFDLPYTYESETLVPWPPSPLVYSYSNKRWQTGSPPDYKEYLKAYHYTYYMQPVGDNKRSYFDEFGTYLELPLHLITLNKTLIDQEKCYLLDSCLDPTFCSVVDEWRMKAGITCFAGEEDPEICGGNVGSPVYGSNFALHGLAMTYYPCGDDRVDNYKKSNTLEVMAITPQMARYIQSLIPELIDTSKEELPMEHLARDHVDYQVYEMPEPKFEVVDYPQSVAAVVTPFWIFNVLVLVLV